MIKYRIASILDVFSIARIHAKAAKSQNGAFMHKLGMPFLVCYYLVFLTSRKSVVLIAEKENNEMLGFHSGTLDMAYQSERLKKFSFLFVIVIVPMVLFSPKLIHECYLRFRSISNGSSKYTYSVNTGVRGDYWCWVSESIFTRHSVIVLIKWLSIMKALNMSKVIVETDDPRIVLLHIKLGAELIKENYLHDGRKRSVLEYNLKDFKYKL